MSDPLPPPLPPPPPSIWRNWVTLAGAVVAASGSLFAFLLLLTLDLTGRERRTLIWAS